MHPEQGIMIREIIIKKDHEIKKKALAEPSLSSCYVHHRKANIVHQASKGRKKIILPPYHTIPSCHISKVVFVL
jgi:hypothetical protein